MKIGVFTTTKCTYAKSSHPNGANFQFQESGKVTQLEALILLQPTVMKKIKMEIP